MNISEERLLYVVLELARLRDELEAKNERSVSASRISDILATVQANALSR